MSTLASIAAGQIDLGLLLLRVVAGATMAVHGWNHIFGGGKIKGTAGWFESLGMRPGILHAWLASITEVAAGAALMAGFLTPLSAGALIGVSVVAWITNHRKAGFFVFRRPTEGWEYLMNLTAAFFAIACLGPGEWSVDHALHFHPSGWWGLGLAAIIGLGGAASLLVVFWRPAPAAS